ncbi:hypothetical protein [Parasulfitobacter algicola]|uniref:Prepilin-type N-terminal cleavage/methylation domain-containing protein n=1 Tax=Parasulfitobacter algicola TaxID=2614809 RepID=A0ABX2J007_9RHOB|nr:hypothetical protein [Sulfitobacter algicola]NSX56917.1 hypothetical protein [Sulfitobacter algicola]
MTLHFKSTSGVSLFEVMLALGILSLMLGVIATSSRGPSDTLLLQQDAAAMQRNLTDLRAQSIQTGQPVSFDTTGLSCDANPKPIVFFSDGSAQGQPLCLRKNDLTLSLILDPLIGRYKIGDIE